MLRGCSHQGRWVVGSVTLLAVFLLEEGERNGDGTGLVLFCFRVQRCGRWTVHFTSPPGRSRSTQCSALQLSREQEMGCPTCGLALLSLIYHLVPFSSSSFRCFSNPECSLSDDLEPNTALAASSISFQDPSFFGFSAKGDRIAGSTDEWMACV